MSFNPNMVRLKAYLDLFCFSPENLFQSQYGSIKSRQANINRTPLMRFNPNMVRLKVIRLRVDGRDVDGFNPNMVRLKAIPI